jgi:hypothetical protein
LKNPLVLLKFLLRLVKREALLVWMPLGWIAAMTTLWIRKKDKAVKIIFFWLLALGLYYLIAIRTTADGWAAYYHVVTVPAAALLLGVGAKFIRDRLMKDRPLMISMGIIILVSLAVIAGRTLFGLSYEKIFPTAVVLTVLWTLLEGNPSLGFPSNARSARCLPSKEHLAIYLQGGNPQ